MWDEFKKFLLRGNVVDLAVAVIVGAAFNKIVTSVVADVVTPLIGLIENAPDFSAIKLGPINIGKFINATLDFVIVSAVVFFGIIKPMKKLQDLTIKQMQKNQLNQKLKQSNIVIIKILRASYFLRMTERIAIL